MGLDSKVNNNDLADEGDGVDSVECTICLETVVKDGDRAWANLQCRHQFHLDCIGSAFNAKGMMQCPNCRKIEKGQWLYANSAHEFTVEDLVHEDDNLDTEGGGDDSQISFVDHWCPFRRSTFPPTFEDREFLPSSHHDFSNQQGYFPEPAASTSGHICSYVTYVEEIHSPSSNRAVGVSDSSHRNMSSGEVHNHGWDLNSPPPTTSIATGSGGIRPILPHLMLPFRSHSSNGRVVARPPHFPSSNARIQARIQSLQAYYQQSSAQSRPIVSSSRWSGRGIASGMGSTSSSSEEAGRSGFTELNIWERDSYVQSQQTYPVNQMDREESFWSSSFNEGYGSFRRHGGGGE